MQSIREEDEEKSVAPIDGIDDDLKFPPLTEQLSAGNFLLLHQRF